MWGTYNCYFQQTTCYISKPVQDSLHFVGYLVLRLPVSCMVLHIVSRDISEWRCAEVSPQLPPGAKTSIHHHALPWLDILISSNGVSSIYGMSLLHPTHVAQMVCHPNVCTLDQQHSDQAHKISDGPRTMCTGTHIVHRFSLNKPHCAA